MLSSPMLAPQNMFDEQPEPPLPAPDTDVGKLFAWFTSNTMGCRYYVDRFTDMESLKDYETVAKAFVASMHSVEQMLSLREHEVDTGSPVHQPGDLREAFTSIRKNIPDKFISTEGDLICHNPVRAFNQTVAQIRRLLIVAGCTEVHLGKFYVVNPTLVNFKNNFHHQLFSEANAELEPFRERVNVNVNLSEPSDSASE